MERKQFRTYYFQFFQVIINWRSTTLSSFTNKIRKMIYVYHCNFPVAIKEASFFPDKGYTHTYIHTN